MSSDTPGIGLLDRLLTLHVRRGWRGGARVRRLLQRHAPAHLIRVRTRHGLTLNVDPDQYVDRVIIRDGYYEPEVLDAVLAHLEPGGVFWDIGANIGQHSLTVRRLRPDATVVCFEPSPFTFSQLATNARLNGGGVELLNVALADREGYFPLSMMTEGNSGLTSLKPWPGLDYTQTMTCRCETALSLLAATGVPSPTVVKIDVEGFELEVLTGFGPLLAEQRLRAVVFEADPERRESLHETPLVRLLVGAGFSISPLQPAASADDPRPSNYVAVKG